MERETTLRLRGCGVVFVCQWTEAYRGGWRAGQRSKGGEAVADGVLGEFGDAAEVEFFHDALAVPDDGLGGDEEGGGDFAGAFALGDELEDFLFARGELAEGNGGGGAGWKLRELIAVEEELAELLPGGMSATEAAVRFALSHASVTSAIVGFSTPGQVDQAIEWAGRGPLGDSLIDALLAKTASA